MINSSKKTNNVVYSLSICRLNALNKNWIKCIYTEFESP